jgi:hypothetical protein
VMGSACTAETHPGTVALPRIDGRGLLAQAGRLA